MEAHERQLVLDQLGSAEAWLRRLTDGLSEEQWRFREAEGRWSIAENIEHVTLFEEFLKGVIVRTMEGAAEPEKKPAAGTKERLVLRLGEMRGTKLTAREVVRPVGRWLDTADMLEALRREQARTRAFVEEIDGPLRDHFFAHIAFGDLDCYQWLVVLAQHGARHARQIEEIKAHPGFPAA